MSKYATRKILHLFLYVTLIANSFCGAIPNVSANAAGNNVYKEFFVSTIGSDNNDGTSEHPFLTIAKAQQAVRQINQTMTGDINVFVAPGNYYIHDRLNFDERDSGFNGHQVYYKSLEAPGSAHLIGGDPLTGGWVQTMASDAAGTDYLSELPSSAVGKVYKVKIDPQKYNFNQLYIGSQKALMARTPNKVEDPKFQASNGPYLESTGGSNKDMSYKASDLTLAQIKALKDAQASGRSEIAQLFVFDCGGSAFESNTLPISRIDTTNNKLYSPYDSAHPELYITKYNINSNGRYFLQGNISFLDTPGEYYYDKHTGWLYYYPTDADNVADVDKMNNLNVVIPTTNEIIHLQGTDKPAISDWGKTPDPAKQVSNITFDGFTLESTESSNYIVDGWSYGETWYAGGTAIPYAPPEAAGSTQPYYSDYAVRPAYMHGGFTLINTNHITIQNSRITNMGLFGIIVWRDNTNNTFQNLAIDNTGMGGINTDGGYPGVGKYNNNNTFYNLSIHHVGQSNAFGAGLQVMNTGFSNFKNLEIYYAPRRAISFVGQAQTMTSASPNFNPVTDVYNYGNHFEYIYVHDAEQDTAEDSAIFIGALFKGSDVNRIYGKNDPTQVTNPATGQPYGDLKVNFFNQIVTSDIGSAPDVRDANTVHGMDLAMGASGTHLSNIEGMNNQSANLRVEPTQNNDKFYVDNINSDYPTSAYNPRLYYTFDVSKMDYDHIGINRQEFPFTSELYNPTSPKLQSNSYFSDDFESGKIDTTKWSIEKGTPIISSAYTAEGPFNGQYSLFINGGAAGNSSGLALSRTFNNNLNKIVTGWFFDKRRDYAGNDWNEGLNNSDVMVQSFMRVDDHTSDKQVGLGINGHTSKDYFSYLDGTTEKLTTIPRTFGWHQFKFDYSTPGQVNLSIDGQLVTTLNRASFNYIGMGNYNSTGAPGTNTGMSYYDLIDVYGGVDAPAVKPLQVVPGKIEAESYSAMSGVQTATSSQEGSYISYLNSGDWADYTINAQTSGAYSIKYRIATGTGFVGGIQILVDGVLLKTTSLPVTGGDPNWTTVTDMIALPTGSHTIRLLGTAGGINLNWFQMDYMGDSLISITAPAPIEGVEIGTTKTAAALGLPGQVVLNTGSGNVNAGVTWDLSNVSYNPTSMNMQSFTVTGIVTLPAGLLNPNNVPLTTSVSVVVNGISHSGMTATATSQETIGENDAASMAIDGNPLTMWHTKWDKSDVLPQSITLNLGRTSNINKISYLPRKSAINGIITGYNVFVSTDGVTFTKVKSGSWASDNSVKYATFTPIDASYVKLEATAGVNGWASAAEINVLLTPPTATQLVSITAPANITGLANGTVKTAVALGLPATVALVTDAGSVNASVTWDVNASSYDPSSHAGQTFTVSGTVTLPDGVANPNNVAMTTSINVTVLAAIPVPDAPTGLTATANATTDVTLNWSAVPGAERYNIYRADSKSGIFEKVNDAEVLATTFTNLNLNPDMVYGYQVTAVNTAGESGYSNVAEINLNVPPVTVAKLDGTKLGEWYQTPVTITLNATDNFSGVADTFYRVDGGTEQKGTSVTIKEEGSHTISYWSVDKAGNVETPHTAVVQLDMTAPTLHVVLDKTILWPANHQMITVSASVYSEDSLSGIESVVLTSIISNESDNGLGDGQTSNDIQGAELGTLDTKFLLCAERSGKGNGRIYTITYTAFDHAGNKTSASSTVTVPHDMHGK
ncbi:carbohydrate-binding protein [Paenibacillus sp. LMG 31460]|uniref:Carbohydrate-binding protein n=1 Tax=Paenibacillus germinis TaxID=2654979 RepID=A0ABX1Z595_9BACL|nr:carbohydrate-binding protein [Paenibacillus germinis]NOU88413.1 carbohydrate-binding protein [Paenibacillus germinis]